LSLNEETSQKSETLLTLDLFFFPAQKKKEVAVRVKRGKHFARSLGDSGERDGARFIKEKGKKSSRKHGSTGQRGREYGALEGKKEDNANSGNKKNPNPSVIRRWAQAALL